jgi:hypothetical protein
MGGTAYVRLPATVDVEYGTTDIQQAPITLAPKNYTAYLPSILPIGSNVPLKLQALVTEQGQLFNNNIKLTETSG